MVKWAWLQAWKSSKLKFDNFPYNEVPLQSKGKIKFEFGAVFKREIKLVFFYFHFIFILVHKNIDMESKTYQGP